MPDPDARQPIDATPPSAVPDAAGVDRPDGTPTDLAAVPSFLRSRLGRAGSERPVAHASTHGPRPATTSIPDVALLPMLGIAPRRLILLGATILLAWMIVSFGRQVAEASASSARAEELRSANAALAQEVAAMERELQVIQDQRYIGQAARAFRLGSPGEIPFALEAGAPPLAADAPGSAASGLGAETATMSPLERWLDVLFGPGG
jgi:cell division protein FtsB